MPIHSSGLLAVGPAGPAASFCALGTAGEERILQMKRVDVNLFYFELLKGKQNYNLLISWFC
jgi:hypothetical protein